MPDMTTENLELDALSHMESEYGVFVSDAGNDQERLREAKQLSQAMIQNGMPASEVLGLLDTNNLASIKSKMRRAEKAAADLQKAQAEAEQQAKQMQMQMQAQQAQMELLEKEKDRQLEIEKALIVAESKDTTDKLNLDLQKLLQDHEIKSKELDLKEKALYTEGDTEPSGE